MLFMTVDHALDIVQHPQLRLNGLLLLRLKLPRLHDVALD
jgi:hypothetical protein